MGSFLNVCIYGILREEYLALRDSHCPICKTSIEPMSFITGLRFLFYRVKCNREILHKYLFIELFNGVIYFILYLRFSLTITFVAYSILASLLLTISVIDWNLQIIPDKLIVFGFVIGFIYKVVGMLHYNVSVSVLNSIEGLLIGGGFFLLISMLSNGGMGGGDIKLIAMLGFWLGWQGTLLIIILSFGLGGIIALLLIVLRLKVYKNVISFSPFISIAAFITICWRMDIICWYINKIV